MHSILLISLILPKYAVAIVSSTWNRFFASFGGISGSNDLFKTHGYNLDDTIQADVHDCPTNINYNTTDDTSNELHWWFTYQGGWLVPNVAFYPIFWSLPNNPVIKKDQLDWFYQDMVGSSFMIALKDDFSVPGQQIGTGSYLGSKTYNTENTTILTDAAIRAKLAEWVANGILPPPNRNTYFSIHFGPGITVLKDERDSVENQCSSWCAYHDIIDVRCAERGPKTVIQYGVVLDASSSKCQNQCVGMAPESFNTCPQWYNKNFDIQTVLSSHEIAEMVTNPFNNSGWFNPKDQFENADYCKSISFFVGPKPRFNTPAFNGCHNRNIPTTISPTVQTPRYAVQQFFSPKQSKCVASTGKITQEEKDDKDTYCNKTTSDPSIILQPYIQKIYTPLDDAAFFTCPTLANV
jgi:hypothetical protein